MSKKYVSRAPSGVLVETELPPPPYEDEDDWMRWGHLSFWIFSYLMWGSKCRQANPVFYAFLTRFVPFVIVAAVVALVLKEIVR